MIIYGLADPRTGCVRYVGQTVQRLSLRLADHVSEARNRRARSHRANWIRALLKLGMRPGIEVLEEVETGLDTAECFWIASLRAAGAQLLNKTDGGETDAAHARSFIKPGWKQTETAKQRISAANKLAVKEGRLALQPGPNRNGPRDDKGRYLPAVR